METVITKTVTWQRDKKVIDFLLSEHFVHITGLIASMHLNDTYKIRANYNQYLKSKKGNIGFNNGMCAVVTPEGFYFIKRNGVQSINKIPENLKEKLSFDSMLGVCCSNSDEINFHHLMDRISNPLSEEYGDPFEGV